MGLSDGREVVAAVRIGAGPAAGHRSTHGVDGSDNGRIAIGNFATEVLGWSFEFECVIISVLWKEDWRGVGGVTQRGLYFLLRLLLYPI